MNKNVKRIVAMALVMGTVSAVAPATDFNLLSTKAYAAENSDDTLDSLELLTDSDSKIKLYDSSSYDSDGKVASGDVEAGEVYYAKTSSSTVNIDIKGPSSKYVRVFKGNSDSAKGKKISSDISLDSDSTTILTVKVYGEEPDDSVRYDEDDDYDLLNTYKIKVKYTGSSEDTKDSSTDTSKAEDYDDIYLEKLSIDGTSIPLSNSKIKYTYDVASDVDQVTVRATPEDEDYDVTIDGHSVDVDDKFKTDIDLDKGSNEIKIEIEDGSDDRVYTLVINRGTTSSTTTNTTANTTTSTPSTATEVTTTKTNQWVKTNGLWQYNDATGKTVKNSWVQNYYVQADGNMATGWTSINGSWYYLGIDGAKKTGWQSVGGSWYYLDSQGIMQTGWIKNLNGKYYYLNSNGSMASNTTIGGYKLDATGAWTGR